MSDEPAEPQALGNIRLLTWAQMSSFVDPLMVLNEEKDYAVKEVEAEAERLGQTIETMDVTVEIRVRAIIK